MKLINITPRSVLSIVLAGSILLNTSTPALAQAHKTSSDKSRSQHFTFEQQTVPTDAIAVRHIEQKIQVQKESMQLSVGSLTTAELRRLDEIKLMFDTSAKSSNKSDLQIFQEAYTKQLNDAYTQEKNALNASRLELMNKGSETATKYRKEIYEPLVRDIASSVWKQTPSDTQTAGKLADMVLKDILALKIDPEKPITDQFSALSKKYAKNPLAQNVVAQVVQQAQTDPDETIRVREEAVVQWQKQAEQEVTSWYDQNIKALDNWKKTNLNNSEKTFDKEYNPKLLKAREDAVKQAVQDLWTYKDKGPIAKHTLLSLAPGFAQVRTLSDKSFFSTQQKNWLVKQYNSIVKNTSCGEENNSSDCTMEILALGALGMLSDSYESANLIADFMTAKHKTAYAVPSLLVGTASLLAMKQYRALNGFLYAASRSEHDLADFDLLSIENLVNAIATLNGQYLGEVSKYAQYPLQENATEKTALGNAWEDVAQLLADDGSPEALKLLREYGVEKCYVFVDTSLSFKNVFKMECAGIVPFLVGALASGQSGAEQYSPVGINTSEGYVADNFGTHYISSEQAKANAALQNGSIAAYHRYAEIMGMTPTAAVARHIFVQSMGDLNAETELRIDTKLYEIYEANMQGRQATEDYGIQSYSRNSETYNDKRASQDRIQIFRKIGYWADIAILAWCIFDISKWAVSGTKIARAVTKASSMARKGATVAERATMLRRLNIAPQLRTIKTIPSKIKGGMTPLVLEQLPLFTSTTVELPKFPGFVQTASKLAGQSLRFSAETGVLSLDVAGMVKQADGTVSTRTAASLNTLMQDAALQTNTQFANRSAWSRFWTWNKDASYRSALSKNLAALGKERGIALEDLGAARLRIETGTISVPQNIASFKAPNLIHSPLGIPTLNQTALNKIMANVSWGSITPEKLGKVEGLLNTAIANANAEFLGINWLSRQWNALRFNYTNRYRSILLDNITAQFDLDQAMFFDPEMYQIFTSITDAIKADKTLQAPAWTSQFITLGKSSSREGNLQSMGAALFQESKSSIPTLLPLSVQLQPKRWMRGGIPGVGAQSYQRIVISPDKKGQFMLMLGNDNLAKLEKAKQFKLTLDAEDVPSLLSAAQGHTGAQLNLKLIATDKLPFKALFRKKSDTYAHKITVQARLSDGTLQTLPVSFNADSFLGLRDVSAVLEPGGKIAWYRDGQLITEMPKFTFGLPKGQLEPFLALLQKGTFNAPIRLSGHAGKNKLTPLMWATGLSLSSASVGLIAPLENIYGDRITETDKTWISLAFPYLPSLAAPLFSPLVMKIGALRTLQLALGISTAGLGFAALNHFNGKVDKQNPPEVWPLFVSGAAIGISSALSRSGLNLLIDSMGGGGTLLKSMMYKNIGSVALLLPPFVANYFDKDIDFSLAFPVLGSLSAGALTWVSASRISTKIGKSEGFMKFRPIEWTNPQKVLWTGMRNIGTLFKETGKHSWETIRLLGSKQVLPLVLAATAFTGFEAGAFNKAGSQIIRPTLKNNELPGFVPETNRNNFVNLLTNLSVIGFPLLARATAKPSLALLKTATDGDEFRRMLKISFALNAAGVALLYSNGYDGYLSPGMLGIALMGLGTANMTQSFQKLSNKSVKLSRYARARTAGLTGKAYDDRMSNLVDKTMTGFPVQQLGIAIVPQIVSKYTDHQIDEGVIQKSDASLSSMWIPILSLAACFGFSAKSIGLFPTRIPTGLAFLTRGLIGSYPAASEEVQNYPSYLTQPDFGVPPGFNPIPTNPIVNMGKIIPPQQALKSIETNIKSNLRKAQAAKSSETTSSEQNTGESASQAKEN